MIWVCKIALLKNKPFALFIPFLPVKKSDTSFCFSPCVKCRNYKRGDIVTPRESPVGGTFRVFEGD